MKISEHKKKMYKRIISMMLVFVLVLGYYPAEFIQEKVKEDTGIIRTVHAATDPDVLAGYIATYGASNSWSFTSGDGRLAQYSKCFEDADFAQNHKGDTIILATTGTGAFVFDSDYEPIGTEDYPFEGKLIFTTSAGSFSISAYTPVFNYVSDAVSFRDTNGTNIPIVINRVGDVGDEISPLFAMHVKGSGLSGPASWLITLDSSSAHSYSGVIYEMYNAAKINLTFTDNSSHTPILDPNGNIISGSIIDNEESGKHYGILCGRLAGSSELTATYTCTDTTNAVTFIGTETAYCGGLIGEINNSTFELLSESSTAKVDFQSAKDQVGFICGHSEGGTITLPTAYDFEGTVDGKVYAGGIAGYCKNTVVSYVSTTGKITLSNCNVKNGTTTGGVFGYYECNTYANDILIDRSYELTNCKVEGTKLNGGVVGEYKPNYSHAVTIDLDKFTLGSTIELKTGETAGGLFGKYTAPGNVTITDSKTDNTHFAPPTSSVAYGGIIGEYVNQNYANTLTLSGFTVNNLNATSDGNVGGVIRQLTGSTYVNVSGVSVTNASVSSATLFGGIVSTLDSGNTGSFIDVTGNFTLTLSSGTYKGGAIAGSFKKGVVRFAGTTDISGAQAANGYSQLIYENDETLVYAKGSGSDSNWTLKRNASTTASDLGQWGEVVRLFKVGDVYKNAEDAEIVSVANNKVTVAQGVTAITDTVSFAKCALNMQLNDGSDHGSLCFADKTTYPKSVLLGSDLTVNGTIDLSGTGLLGFMRDGGNGKYLDTSNTFKNIEFFTGSIVGSNNAEIKMATGELYGTYEGTSSGTGGKIYLANNYGHDSQGLFAFAKAASITNIKISGTIDVERNAGSDYLYVGALFGAITNGADLSGVDITTTISTTRTGDIRFYIGGVSGVYDGKETPETGSYDLTIEDSSTIKPTINLYGVIGCESGFDKKSTYVGGILGLLKGLSSTKYGVAISSSDVSPSIIIGDAVVDTDLSYLGGMIGRVAKNTTNARTISLKSVTMTNARVDTKAKHAGGLLGAMWETTDVTIDGLAISGSNVYHKYSNTGSNKSGLVFMGTGKWDIKSLSLSNTTFSSTDTASASFGLIVNQAYSGNDGLYINLKNSGYTLSEVTVPTASTDTNYYVDEIAADTCNEDILAGGNGTGIVNINMNAESGTKTKITDVSGTTENGTGTYQNKLSSQLGNLIGNQNSRYYYNLDAMLAKGDKGSTAPTGEQFLLWSVRKYAAGNIRGYFKSDDNMITGTAIELSGLSYYPIPGGEVTLPTGATITFGFKAINDYENRTITPDSWSRNPDDVGTPNSTNARNQHYLMQTGLFTTVTSLTANTLTLAGDFGYVENVASGALINGSTSGSVSLTGLTLNKLTPSNSNSYLLMNYINGTGDALPSLTVSKLRATNYNTTGVTLPVAKSLFGKAQGQNMTMNFSDIKLDARDGTPPTGKGWDSTAASNMNSKYGTSRSIFSAATFFTELLAAKTSTMEYNYTVEEDWGTENSRNVTYGKEVTSSKEYENGEKRYSISSGTGHFTNPVSDSNTEFDFSVGFLPYVANYVNKGVDATYPVVEIKVNYKVAGLIDGCGTYNDPYIISTTDQLKLVADVVNNGTAPSPLRLPNEYNADHVITSWHGANGDGLYNLPSGQSTYSKDTTNTQGISSWTKDRVRYYLASAYYVINADLTGTNSLPADFEGIGKPSSTTNGNTVFHGVIIGKKSNGSAPTITNPSPNPLIYISNGSVVKNLNIYVTANISRSLDRQGDNALYGYKPNDSTNKGAEYYGGVIGEIMGGDNIIDDVSVTYTGTTTLSGGSSKDYKHLIAEGGMVGCVVNGALIFRGSNSVTGRTVSGGGIYSNQFVGRVINGSAVYEQISGRTGSAPDNYNKITTDDEDNETKTYTYPIDTIDRSNTNKLDINWSNSTITVPDAQSLYIMSLITQSIASTADTSDSNEKYGEYSPSYGYNGYVTGVARLGDYSGVNCGASAAKPTDYSDYAAFDSINNYTSSTKDGLMKAPVPYIIYRYTTRKSTTATNPAADFPARRMTSDNNKFWDITLSSSNTFNTFGDNFKAFRGIGCVGINAYRTNNDASKTAMKVATFNGGGNTIKLHISLPRYGRDQENYYHKQNKSLTQSYSGDVLDGDTPYGHDENLVKLMGLGLFDCVMVNYDSTHENQFQDFYLKGTIEDKVFNTSGTVITGTTGQTQLFCVGGVVGKRIFGNDSDINFNSIIFDGLSITGAYACGGLIGEDAIGKKGLKSDSSEDNNAKKKMKISGCNSTENGISIIGGYYGHQTEGLRHGIGSFVGMTFWCRPYINGGTNKSDIYVSSVSTFYAGGGNRCAVGGLIGYTGSGAEIKNINLRGLGSNPVVGATNVANAAGFIGFTQAMTTTAPTLSNYSTECVDIENCTLNNISVKALNNAAGFLARCGNTTTTWYPKYIKISNCAVIGDSQNKPEIRAYVTSSSDKNKHRFGAGGFVADFSINSNTSVITSVIENSYIEGYSIEGSNVGGIIGTETTKPAYLRNIYVRDCDIITTFSTENAVGNIGGIVGRSEQNLSGYNLKIDGVNFYRRSGDTLTDVTTTDAGIIVGRNSSSLVDKFVAICAYHSTESKVPTSVVKTNDTNTGNFFVFADYLNTSATDITSGTGHASTFGNTNTDNGTSNATMPLAPYINTTPHMGMGTDEYITGDGASIGKAGEIYKDAKANSSNRRYTVGTTTDPSFASTEKNDSTVLAKYINNDGTYKTSGAFKISTASAEFGTLPTGVQNFAMLVINDDTDKTNDITPFIKSYIRLVTNAEKSSNQYKNNQYAYATSGYTNVNNLYQVVIRPCYYSEADGKFVLGTAGAQGLTSSDGLYSFVSANADSEAGNYQFSLIDVQFKDPTSPTVSGGTTSYNNIAYHLYVPVYTKKMLAAKFSAVTMTSTHYSRNKYANKIASEIAAGCNIINPSQLVENTGEWTTTFIRYTYPKNQIDANAEWNFDKKIRITLDPNFATLPAGTEMILLDPNANSDRFYKYTVPSNITQGTEFEISLSSFLDVDNENTPFTPKTLKEISSSAEASNSAGTELYEDYYISLYVPVTSNGTHGILFSSGNEMTYTGEATTETQKANIESNLWSFVVVGDLFTHNITDYSVSPNSREILPESNTIINKVTATVKLKNPYAAPYLSNSDVLQSFFITLTSHEEDGTVTDTINGTSQSYITNSTSISYSYNDDLSDPISSGSATEKKLGENYVQLNTGSIKNILLMADESLNYPTVIIQSESTISFVDINAFPYNPEPRPDDHVGTQVSIKSNLAYQSEDLLYSSMKKTKEDPAGTFYYVRTRNGAELNFSAVADNDEADEIGLKTNNRSLLGVNGKYSTNPPIKGKSIYNANDILNYDRATDIVYKISLWKKVTNITTGKTVYQKVNNISQYLNNVALSDKEVTLEADITDDSKYVYTGQIDHTDSRDKDKMFEADFSCNVLTSKKEYANYKIQMEVELTGASNTYKKSYIVYTYAKFDPSVIDDE